MGLFQRPRSTRTPVTASKTAFVREQRSFYRSTPNVSCSTASLSSARTKTFCEAGYRKNRAAEPYARPDHFGGANHRRVRSRSRRSGAGPRLTLQWKLTSPSSATAEHRPCVESSTPRRLRRGWPSEHKSALVAQPGRSRAATGRLWTRLPPYLPSSTARTPVVTEVDPVEVRAWQFGAVWSAFPLLARGGLRPACLLLCLVIAYPPNRVSIAPYWQLTKRDQIGVRWSAGVAGATVAFDNWESTLNYVFYADTRLSSGHGCGRIIEGRRKRASVLRSSRRRCSHNSACPTLPA